MLSCNVVFCGDSITAGNHLFPDPGYPELVASMMTARGRPITMHKQVHPTIFGNNYLPSAFIASIETIAREGFTGLQLLRAS